MRRVAIVGGGMADSGKRAAKWRDLASEAVKQIVDDVGGLNKSDIDGFLVTTVQPERFCFQSHLAPIVSEIDLLHTTTLRIPARYLYANVKCPKGVREILDLM